MRVKDVLYSTSTFIRMLKFTYKQRDNVDPMSVFLFQLSIESWEIKYRFIAPPLLFMGILSYLFITPPTT